MANAVFQSDSGNVLNVGPGGIIDVQAGGTFRTDPSASCSFDTLTVVTVSASGIAARTAAGLTIGLASDLLGFYAAPPVVQPANATQAAVVAITGGESPTEAEHNALVTLLNAMRTALVNLGLIKGSA